MFKRKAFVCAPHYIQPLIPNQEVVPMNPVMTQQRILAQVYLEYHFESN
jgi:hypothetical protein